MKLRRRKNNMGISFIFRNDKEKLIKQLGYYGIKKLPYLLTKSGKEKIRGYSGSLTTNEITELNNEIGIELLGIYLFHDYHDNMRLSFDAIYALKDQITENVIELDDKQAEEYLKGRDLALSNADKEKFKSESLGFKIIKHGDEFIGTGKLTGDRIVNYMPKERRLR
jgi:NOL1/NOP2/fmu family ribosome biogenesis protein